jgi:hypothetical protein
VLADRRFRRVEPAPIPIAAASPEPVATEPVPTVEPVPAAAAAPSVVTTAPRRRMTLRRRLRNLAAGALEQAEAWLRAPEAETDRR